MKLGLRFWGPLARSVAGECQEFALPDEEISLQAAVVAYLEQTGRAKLWDELLHCAFAVNDQIVGASHRLRHGDIIDVLPPVSGG